MTELSCEAWMEIEDRRAIGEPVSEEERRLAEAHRRQCPFCADEAATWEALSHELGPDEAQAEPDPPSVDAVMRRLESERGSPRTRRPRRIRAAVWAGGVLAAAAAALLIWGPSAGPDGGHSGMRAEVLVGRFASGGRLASSGAALPSGQTARVETERACLQIGGATKLCAARASELTWASLERQGRVVQLHRGRVALELDSLDRGRFVVRTDEGAVEATGTVFSVEAGSQGTIARLHEGEVRVTEDGGRSTTLGAGEQLRMGAGEPSPLAKSEMRTDWKLLGKALGPAVDAGTSARADAAQARDRALDAGADAGPGEHADAGGGRAQRDPPARRATARARMRRRMRKDARRQPQPEVQQPQSAESPADAGPAAPSAGELLRRGRQLRAEGKPGAAARAYRKLRGTHPGSAEARVALVSLGQLQRTALGQPRAALRSFDSYLEQSGGALRQEAELGRIRALRDLGHDDRARGATKRFLRRYPDSPHAQRLRKHMRDR